ncbi:hypothetical protein [Streptomyces sp. NBC_00582]|uniref:hypothetical protein n=1 Tax=Streptomyces sp. NBC_00582 TaxID=2975783 RepID=UPI0010624A5E|nr:hypothetical protein [Streptomyces sp. NBC_00582]WUB59080.1 hypothetical protein OG852_00780 [Streptomyces sp. NBC_00582]WUB67648.1 hypothetical protein OG852_48355 [Streptomyces sp. NBC_00582]
MRINLATLAERSQRVLKLEEPIEAVGIFGLQDDYLGLAVGGVASGTVASILDADALTDGVLAAIGIRAARRVNANSQGVTVRMVVVVTATSIHLLALSGWGYEPERELLRMNRATTTSQVKWWGLSRRLKLRDADGQKIELTSSISYLSFYRKGAKAILAALASNAA